MNGEGSGSECWSVLLPRLYCDITGPCCHRERRVQAAEDRYKDYRQELKQHAQALKKVSQELQVERHHRNQLQTTLDKSHQELQDQEKSLRDEQGTSNLLREQVQ